MLALLLVASARAADRDELQGRRQSAAAIFPDGILLVHARSAPDEEADGFRQDLAFYYFTGLENSVGAILAIDGRSCASWLFLPTHAPYGKILPLEDSPYSAAVGKAGIQPVADWSELEGFLAAASGVRLPLHNVSENAIAELPPNLTDQSVLLAEDGSESQLPLWVAVLGKRWPSFVLTERPALE